MFARININDKAEFYENIANLLEGGVSLLDALRGFHDRTENPRLKQEVNNLLFFTEAGDPLSTAMRKLPNFFSDQEIALIEAGEQTGTLQVSLMAVSVDLRDQEDLRRQIVGALTYPFIILLFLLIAGIIVMVYVIPQLIPILTQNSEVPFVTQTFIGTSNFIRNNILSIILFFVAIFLVARALISTKNGRLAFDTFLIKMPVIGRVYRNYLTVRYTSTLSLLMGAGITILKVFRLTGKSTGNAYANMIFTKTADGISRGEKISGAMEEADPNKILFTSNILQMISAAEKTSTVDVVTRKISEQYHRQVASAISIMVKYIEPIAILIAGVFVLWFALAIFATIMQISSSANI